MHGSGISCREDVEPCLVLLRRHCEERKRRRNPSIPVLRHGLLRFARNDDGASCLKTESENPAVVPAKAGTHYHRLAL